PNTNWRDDARVLLAQLPGAVALAQATAAQADATLVAGAASMQSPVAIAPRAPDGIFYTPLPSTNLQGLAAITGTPLPAQGIGGSSLYYIDPLDGSSNDDDP